MWSAIEAEQALLGAILCDPAGQRHVPDLVEPGDMLRPWHGQVLAAMRRLRGRGATLSAAEVYQELQADADLPRSVALDAVPLAALMEAAPRPEHAGAYAAIVVEAEIRRRLQLTGSHLVQAAEPEDLDAALAQVTRARADLAACATRWTALPRSLRAEPDGMPRPRREQLRPRPRVTKQATRVPRNPLSIHNTAVGADPAPAAGHDGRAATTPDSRPAEATAVRPAGSTCERDSLARAASTATLRDLIDDPSQLEVVGRWLRPGHFASAVQEQLYTLLHDMRAADKAIDPVTVAWEAACRGLRTDPGRLAGGIGAFAVADAREVHRHGTLIQITQAGNGIQADAADPARAISPVLRTAAERLDLLLSEPQPGCEAVPSAGSARQLCRVPGRGGGLPEPEAAP
jgi:replicative DNA helicase